MEIHLLGTAGYHPNENRHSACFFLPETGVVLDAGTGFFRVRSRVQTRDLHVVLSHAHLDHCVGLSFYLDLTSDDLVDRINIYGEAEKLQAIQDHLFSQHLFPLKPDANWVSIGGQVAAAQQLPGQARLSSIPLEHPGGSLGFRIDWPDRSLAYITDTTAHPKAKYVDFINGVDLLLHECHFPDGHESLAATTGHSCLTPVAEVCAAANVKRAILVHISPYLTEDSPLNLASVRSIFPNLSVGSDQQVVEF